MSKRKIIREAFKTMHGRADYEFFFDNLASSDWLVALKEEGVFAEPEPPVVEGDTVRFPFWPPAAYLINVAAEKPEEVLNIILNVKESENPRVHEAFVSASLKMPPEVAAKMAKRVAKWIDNKYSFVLPEKAADYVLHLASAGINDKAFLVASRLLAVTKHSDGDGESAFRRADPVIRSDWDYEQVVEKLSENLVWPQTIGLIKLLSEKLAAVVQIEEKSKEGEFVDYSHIWRGSVEDSDQNHDSGLKDLLIKSIRDLSEKALAEHFDDAKDLIDFLFAKPFPIHSRIAIHLVRIFKDQMRDQVRDILFNKKFIDCVDVWHEYSLLLEEGFKILESEEKKKFLEMVMAIGKPRPGDEKVAEAADLTKFQLYYMIRDQLDGVFAADFSPLEKKYGPQDHPTFQSYSSGVWHGPESPKTSAELLEMSNEKLAAYLKDWKSTGGFFDSSEDGLAMAFEQAVASDPARFVKELDLFRFEKPLYVRSVIQGLNNALNGERTLNWDLVLKYLVWVSGIPSKEEGTERWSWNRSAASRLLVKGMHEKKAPLPIDLREYVFHVIESNLTEPDPTEEREKDRNGLKGYYELAINSARGQALEAAIQYGLWILRSRGVNSGSVDFYPELIKVLDRHLNLKIEKSLAVHCLYGRWLPFLMTLSADWVKANIQKIFPSGEEFTSYRDAAWNAYIKFAGAYDDVFKLIESEYLASIEKLESAKEKDEEDYRTSLVGHIVLLYLRGQIKIDSPILNRLIEKSDSKLRAKIIFTMGRHMAHKEIQKDAVDLAVRYFDSRVEACKKITEVSERRELSDFGWWMRSPALDDKWVLETAINVMRLAGALKPDHMAAERLLKTAEKFPKLSAEVLELMVDLRIGDYGYLGWLEKAQPLLTLLYNSEAKAKALAILDKIGALGIKNFEGLIQEA